MANTSTASTSGEINPRLSDPDVVALEDLRRAYAAIRSELAKAIVGQNAVIEELLIAILTGSHALLVGVPGLAKTLLISSIAQTLDLSFKRIQFTPDLMPTDITGTEVIHQDQATGERSFKFLKGPIFANVVLADEINRTPPKTQASLLEAMQEKRVTVGGNDHGLPHPFFVLATQNPVEQEGTYPLPEAQLDRFLFMIQVDYPTAGEELAIMKAATGGGLGKPQKVLGGPQIIALQQLIRRVPVADHVLQYAQRIVASTRVKTPDALDVCKQFLTWGAGPRASLGLILAAKARAALSGRSFVAHEDVAAVAPAVLRHRIICSFNAASEGVTTDEVVKRILGAIKKDQQFTSAQEGA
jgi:MoxR-like ATPase